MNYKKTYNDLIERAKTRETDPMEYYENHHIVPKCVGGSNNRNNMVLLTAREHFLAHWLLVKMFPDNFKLSFAFNAFCQNNRGNRPVSRLYEYARKNHIKMLKQNTDWKNKISNTMTKKIWIKKENKCLRVEEHELQNYIGDGWELGRIIKKRKPHSEETKSKQSLAKMGKKMPDGFAENNSKIVKGKIWIHNPETKQHKMIHKAHLKDYPSWELGRMFKKRKRNN